MKKIYTIQDFKNSIGKRFRVEGISGKQDIIIKVHDAIEQVEGEIFIAYYKDCRLIQDPPPQFTKRTKTL